MTTTSRYAFIAVFLIVGFMMPGIAAIRLASPAQQLHKDLDPPAAAEMLLERVAKFKNIVSSEVENKRKQHFIDQVVDALNTSEAFNHTKVLAVIKEEALKAGLVSDAKAFAKGMREAHFGDSLNVGFSVLNRMPSVLQLIQWLCGKVPSKVTTPAFCENSWFVPKIAVSIAAFINYEFAANKFIPCMGIYPHAFFLSGPAWELRGVDFFIGIANKANVPGASFAYDGNYDIESKKPLCPRGELNIVEYQDEIFRDGLDEFFTHNFGDDGILKRKMFHKKESNEVSMKEGSKVDRVCFKIGPNLNGKTTEDDEPYSSPHTEHLTGDERKAALKHLFGMGGFDPRGCVPWKAAKDNVRQWFMKPPGLADAASVDDADPAAAAASLSDIEISVTSAAEETKRTATAVGTRNPYPLVLKSIVVLTNNNGRCYTDSPDGTKQERNDNSFIWNTISTVSVGVEHTATSPPDLIEIYAGICFQGTTQGGECFDRERPSDPWTMTKPSYEEADDKEEWWTFQRARQLDEGQLADLKLPTFWDNRFTLDIGTYGWTWCANETDGSLSTR